MKRLGFLLAAIGLLGVLLIGLGVGNPSSPVLMLGTTDDATEAYSMADLHYALIHGGSLQIRLDQLRSEFREFEQQYAITNSQGKYLVNGAIINFVVDHGWTYEAEMLGKMVFTKTPFLYRILQGIRRSMRPAAP